MNLDKLEKTINESFEKKEKVNPKSDIAAGVAGNLGPGQSETAGSIKLIRLRLVLKKHKRSSWAFMFSQKHM